MPYADPAAKKRQDQIYYRANRSRYLQRQQRWRRLEKLNNTGHSLRYSRKRDNKHKAIVDDLKDEPCADCGIAYPFYVMQFDHARGEKLFELSLVRSGRLRVPLEMLIQEAAKCDVVCANCHAIRTHQRSLSRGGSS